MPITELRFNRVGKKIFMFGFIFMVALFAILAVIYVGISNSLIKAQMEKRGTAMANYMTKTSIFYYTNYDLGALDGFVQEVIKDPDVAYAVFYDENRNALTVTSKKPSDIGPLMNHENEIKDEAGKTVGFLSIGYNTKSVSAAARKGILIMLVTMAVTLVVLAFGITIFVSRVITGPLDKAVKAAERLKERDLTVQLDEGSGDEIGLLLSALKDMVATLKTVMAQVTASTLDVSSASYSISAATEQQATVASEQSAAVAEITATMEELSASSSQIAEHAQAVLSLATGSWENTKKGARSVESVIMKMGEIDVDNKNSAREIVELGRKSKEITKVMEIINTVADQTKLIAFNAALEASSAGEAGKRFGVVAVEIRRLADSVMESTGEIEAKISEIQEAINRLVIASEKSSKGIQEGLQSSQETAAMIMDIVDVAQTTQEAAKQISLSTQQQKTASSQVVTALKEIESGSDQTTDAISQISSISRKLTKLSDSLKSEVEKFRIS